MIRRAAMIAAVAATLLTVSEARAQRDLTPTQAERIVRMCKENPRGKQCAVFALLCARSSYRLGDEKHKVCETLRLVAPRGSLVTVTGVRYRWVADPEPLGDLSHLVEASYVGRGILARTGLAVGADLSLGRGTDGGTAFAGALSLGVGTTFAGSYGAGLLVGVGADGVTGDRVPTALVVPVELFVAGNVGRWSHGLAWVRHSFVGYADRRDDGADRALFGDELSVGVGVGAGRNRPSVGHRAARGVMLAVEYRELLGTSMIGVVLAYSSVRNGAGAASFARW